VAELIQPDVLEAIETDLMHPLRLNLMDNDNFDWAPIRTLDMYYCTQDEQVFFSNSLDADSAMAANGSTSATAIFSGDTDHGGCYFPSMFAALTSFEAVKIGCVTSLTEVEFEVGIGPNPVISELQISSVAPITRLEVFNIKGQLVIDESFSSAQQKMALNVEGIVSGRYQIRLPSVTGQTVSKAIVKE